MIKVTGSRLFYLNLCCSFIVLLHLFFFNHLVFASEHKTHSTKHKIKHIAHKKIIKSASHSKKRQIVHIKKKCFHETPKAYTYLEQPPTPQYNQNTPMPTFACSIEQHFVNFVHRVISTLHYSAYKLGGTHFDTSRGVYIVDCSDYVNHLLEIVYPNAYSDLLNSIGSDKPTSQLYYNFFNDLAGDPNHAWSKIDDAEQLQAGDIIVFRKNAYGRIGRGHVMVVMEKPIRDMDILMVRVTDSAPSGHSEDTRQRHNTGIGIGTLFLKLHPETGQLTAYAWKEGAPWESNVKFAMARPLHTNLTTLSDANLNIPAVNYYTDHANSEMIA